MRGNWLLWLAAGILALPAARGEEEDGPGRGVARLSVIQGDVSVRRGDSGDWVAGAVNAPLVVQDHVVTGAASRAEVQFDWANMVRLASETEIRLAELEYRRYQVQLSRGTIMLRVLRDTDAEIEVNTPEVSLRPLRKGSYRVTVHGTESEITVRAGEAEVYTPRGSERLRSGRTMLVRGAGASPEFRTIAAIPRDRFDEWNEDRDRYLERARSYRYVSPDIYGADDLDYYGRWVWVAPYGWVWTPWGVAAWWAPYRYGRWVWVDWYGWTWLSYDPWGWAPFHYGRWFWHPPYGWCWYPGPRHRRHYWRPALVAFFGLNVGGVHLGFGFGRIGWVPLAPHEPFYPWYGPRHYRGYRHPTFIDNSVRIINNIQIVNVYRNARVTNAISGVDVDGFVRGGRVQPLRAAEAELRGARLVQGPVPVVPAAESVRFADRPAPMPQGSARSAPERFFSRRPAPAIERVPFEEQRRSMEYLLRRAFGASEVGAASPVLAGESAPAGEPARIGGPVRRLGPARPAEPDRSGEPVHGIGGQPEGEPPVAGARGMPGMPEGVRIWRAESAPAPDRGVGRGWRRLGEPVRETSPAEGIPAAETGAGQVRGGWRRFGEPPRGERGNLSRLEDIGPGQWRRLGGTAPAENLENTQGGAMRRSAEERGWRRFGEPLNRGPAPARGPREDAGSPGRSMEVPSAEPMPEHETPALPRQPEEGWRRFSGPRVGSPRVETEPGDAGPRWGAPAWRSEPREAEPPPGGIRRSEPIFINPPIIRERATPRWEGGPRWSGGEIRSGEVPRGEIRGGSIRGEARGGGARGEIRGGVPRSGEGGARTGTRAGGPR